MARKMTLREKAARCGSLDSLKRMLARADAHDIYGQANALAEELHRHGNAEWGDAVFAESTARRCVNTSVQDARITINGSHDLAGLRLALYREGLRGVGARQGLLATLRRRIRELERMARTGASPAGRKGNQA